MLGLAGWVRLIMDRLPMPIVMGMVAGVFVQFGLDWIHSFKNEVMLVTAMTATFFVLTAMPRLQRWFPPMVAVLAVGVVMLLLGGDVSAANTTSGPVLAAPIFYMPVFSVAAALELVVPLAITVIAAQNAQGVVILRAAGHHPPVNAITMACGAASLVTAPLGSVSSCLTGPSNALLTSSGSQDRHWQAAVILGCFAILFGIFSPFVTSLLTSTPTAFLSTLAGLALCVHCWGRFRQALAQDFRLAD